MSRFSGKCDFCDEIEIMGLERILKAKVYVGNSDEPLILNSIEDCIPYYPYVVTTAGFSPGNDVIHLTSKSWVDICEERYGTCNTYQYYRNELAEEMKKYGL